MHSKMTVIWLWSQFSLFSQYISTLSPDMESCVEMFIIVRVHFSVSDISGGYYIALDFSDIYLQFSFLKLYKANFAASGRIPLIFVILQKW